MEKFNLSEIQQLLFGDKNKLSSMLEDTFDPRAKEKKINSQQKIVNLLFGELKDNLDNFETLVDQLINEKEKESLKRILQQTADTFAKMEIEVNRVWQ